MKLYTLHLQKYNHEPYGGGVWEFVKICVEHLGATELTFSDNVIQYATPDSVWIIDGYWWQVSEIYKHGGIVIIISHGLEMALRDITHMYADGLTLSQMDMIRSAADLTAKTKQMQFPDEDPFHTCPIILVAVSKHNANMMWKYCRVLPHVIIENPVDTEIFTPVNPQRVPGKRLRIGGRFQGINKGQELMEFTKKHLDPDKYELVEMKKIKPEDRPAYYQSLDVWLSVSLHEGCSFVINEALASGLPIVSTNAGMLDDTDLLSIYDIGNIFDATRLSMSLPLEVKATHIIQQLDNMYEKLHAGYKPKSRQLAVDKLSIKTWKTKWETFLNYLEKTYL